MVDVEPTTVVVVLLCNVCLAKRACLTSIPNQQSTVCSTLSRILSKIVNFVINYETIRDIKRVCILVIR